MNQMFEYDPLAMDEVVNMATPNEQLTVYKGEFIIKSKTINNKVTGELIYKWFPIRAIHFTGLMSHELSNINKSELILDTYSLSIDGIEIGNCFLRFIGSKESQNQYEVKGILSSQTIIGDKTIKVKNVRFTLINFSDYIGQFITYNDKSTGRGRFSLINENYEILIDKAIDFSGKIDLLHESGGYLITHNCQVKLINEKKSLSYSDVNSLMDCLSTFLSFIRGSTISSFTVQGIINNEPVWTDYTTYSNDNFKPVKTWSTGQDSEILSSIWNRFNKIWERDKNFLLLLSQWYTDANRHESIIEGALIFSQTALELIYNWWIIEEKKIILGKDSENISASNKIRLILAQMNLNSAVPPSLKFLKEFVYSMKDIQDGPEAIVQIRNSIVHSQVEKRKKFVLISSEVKYEALQLSLWYIELSFLKIMEYKGQYFNRTSNEIFTVKCIEPLPWL